MGKAINEGLRVKGLPTGHVWYGITYSMSEIVMLS